MRFALIIVYFLVGVGVSQFAETRMQVHCNTDEGFGFVRSFVTAWIWPTPLMSVLLRETVGPNVSGEYKQRICGEVFGWSALNLKHPTIGNGGAQ